MTSNRANVLFLFAHQDDEFACAQHLKWETERNPDSIFCLFATDGEGHGIHSSLRDSESTRALEGLGVKKENIFFLGSTSRTPDGALVEHLAAAREASLRLLSQQKWNRIYCPAWEGGHQDHDATHLLAQALARDFQVPAKEVWEFTIYNGYRMPWKFFRVLRPIPHGQEFSSIYLSFGEVIKQWRMMFHYRSQWKTWLAFMPDITWNLFFRRREVCQRACAERLHASPHEGPLLYEKIFGFPVARFKKAQKSFQDSLTRNNH